jgi:hypothetical protein
VGWLHGVSAVGIQNTKSLFYLACIFACCYFHCFMGEETRICLLRFRDSLFMVKYC